MDDASYQLNAFDKNWTLDVKRNKYVSIFTPLNKYLKTCVVCKMKFKKRTDSEFSCE